MSQIFLRELSESDITDDYLFWFRDDDVTKFLEVDGKSLTKEKVVNYIREGKSTGTYFMYAICLSESKQHIGNLKIGPINKKHNISDLVTVIWNKKYWGKGFATEAIRMGIRLAFEKYGIRKLSASIHSDNIGSIKSYTEAGFFIEGKLKNHYYVDGKYCDLIMVSCFNLAL